MAAKKTLIVRWVLAGPVTLVVAIMVMAGGPLWFPTGSAGIDNLTFPLLLFPLFWAVPFFYVLLEENMLRASIVLGSIVSLHVLLIYQAFQA